MSTPTVTMSHGDDDSTISLTVKVPRGTAIELEVENPPAVE